MKIYKEELLQGVSETGFRPEILEKVWRLMSILDGINTHPFLKNRLVLKGGTAVPKNVIKRVHFVSLSD